MRTPLRAELECDRPCLWECPIAHGVTYTDNRALPARIAGQLANYFLVWRPSMTNPISPMAANAAPPTNVADGPIQSQSTPATKLAAKSDGMDAPFRGVGCAIVRGVFTTSMKGGVHDED